MTNREAGINVVREMMGDQAAAKLSASAGSNTFGAPIAASRSTKPLQISGLVPVWTGAPAAWWRCPS